MSTTEGTEHPDEHHVTVFTAVGGQVFFDRLVERFYVRVAGDEVLLRLYPEQEDHGPARERLALFLGQFWGGPQVYTEQRGHPRLRMRHVPFPIGDRERDRWVAAMDEALHETLPEAPLGEELRTEVGRRMHDYFEQAATHMINQAG